MLKEKRKELSSAANKLRNGLNKIDETREKVQLMSVELEVAQAQGMFHLLMWSGFCFSCAITES